MINATYNPAEFVKAAMGSVLNQSQCLTLDHASEDDTHSVVKFNGDKKIRYIRHTVNLGRGGCQEWPGS